MERLIAKTVQPYYETETVQLYCQDTFKTLAKMKAGNIDMIFSDPPYLSDFTEEILRRDIIFPKLFFLPTPKIKSKKVSG